MSLALYRLLAKGIPVAATDLAEAARVPLTRVEAALGEWYGVRFDDKGRVNGYWGLTLEPTKHRMRIGDRTLFAWCA